MYSKKEIREIIAESVAEEIYSLGETKGKEYDSLQSLKARLYEAFGLEDDVL